MLAHKRLEILGAGHLALRKSFSKRAVPAKARSNVAPLRNQRRVRRTPSHVAANTHRAERAPVITLPPRNHAVALRLPGFHVILANHLDGGFRRLGAAAGEVNSPAV